MVRARSPLFFTNFLLAWWVGVMLTVIHHIQTPNPLAPEAWRKNEELTLRILQLSGGVAAILGGILLVFLAMEVAISLGWEPRALELFRPGCEILEFQPKTPQKSAYVLVRLADKSVQSYIADREEIQELEIGSIAHLWVIGKQISRIRTLQTNAILIPASRAEQLDVEPQKNAFQAWITISILFLLSVYVAGTGFLPMITREFVVNASSRRSRNLYVEAGPMVGGIGFVAFLLGVAGVFGLCYLWKRGWDESMFEGSQQVWDERPFSWWR